MLDKAKGPPLVATATTPKVENEVSTYDITARRDKRNSKNSFPLVSETVPEEPVSEAAPSAEPSPMVEESPEAPIHVLAPLTSHRERDEDYPTLIKLSDVARVIDCKDGLQWILQRRYGDQWRGVAFCRGRDTLIREAKRLLGHVSETLLGLPEHHDGPIDEPPRCGVCGRLSGKPSRELPRHFFCLADRRAAA